MSERHAIEIVTSWGDELLDVVYVPPSRARRWVAGTTVTDHVTREVRVVTPVEPIADLESRTDWSFWCVMAASTAFHGAFLVMIALMPRAGDGFAASLTPLPASTRDNPAPGRARLRPARDLSTPEDFAEGMGARRVARDGRSGARVPLVVRSQRASVAAPVRARAVQVPIADADARAGGIVGVLRTTLAWDTENSPFTRALAAQTPRGDAGERGAESRGPGSGGFGMGSRDGVSHVGRCYYDGEARRSDAATCGRTEGTIGLGLLTTLGVVGGAGGGRRSVVAARGLEARKALVPRFFCGGARGCGYTVEGGLSREVIRRVIARHRAEVGYCYERELDRRPELAGRVVVTFVIAASGAVQTAAVKSSDLNSIETENCVVAAVARWSFPAPAGGGVVVVDYPFVFESVAR